MPAAHLAALGLTGADPAWRAYAASLEPRALDLPDGAALDALLRRLGLTDEDRAELPGRVAAVLCDPAARWLAGVAAAALHEGVGRLSPDPAAPRWPLPPLERPPGRAAYVTALLATVGSVRAEHARRGVPEDVSWLSLAELGRQLRLHRRATGRFGTDEPGWLANAWSGRLLTVGRLQGEYVDEATASLHIPETGPLAPEAVAESLARLRAGWPRWYGCAPRDWRCDSWLLDPALVEVLGERSNIVRFQRRFVLVPGGERIADAGVLYFVFGRRDVAVPEGLGELPQRTRLERAVVERLKSGGHWVARVGRLAVGD